MEDTLRIGLFIVVLAVLFVYDARRGVLPDFITLPAIVIAALWNGLGGHVAWVSMLWGAIAVGGFFALQYFVSRGRWIGDGDLRMGVLIGAMLGSWPAVIAMFMAYVLGALVGVGLVLAGERLRTSTVPFGTFLAIATASMLVYGDLIVAWYAQWLR